MNLDDVAEALAEALESIDGLRSASEIPQQVNPPVAVVGLGSGTYETLEGLGSATFGLLVLLSAADSRRAQKALRGYCSATGSQSVKAAVESPALTLAGVSTGVSAIVRSWSAPVVVTLGETDYIGLEFQAEVTE